MRRTKLQRLQSLGVTAFFLLLTLIGLLQIPDYGVPCDEASEQVILLSNMAQYAVALQGNDAPMALKAAEIGVPVISQYKERDHGECAFYPFAWILNVENTRARMLLWHGAIFLWFMVGVVSVYGFCRVTGLTRVVSCLGSLLLYVNPRFYAEGHYNNKDIVLLSLFLAVLWAGAAFLKKPGFLRALLFSLLGAMAANMRVIGIVPWGLIGLAAVVLVSVRKEWSSRMVLVAISAIVSFVLFFLVFTPAAWPDLRGYLNYVLSSSGDFERWNGVVLFRGEIFYHRTNPLPRSYLPYMIVTTLPLHILPLAAAGGLHTVLDFIRGPRDRIKDPAFWAVVCAVLASLLPLGYAVLTRVNVYNGWRHVYFVYSGIVLLGAHGISAIRCFLRKHGGDYGMHHVFALGLCLFIAFIGFDMYRNHPYEYAYYNLLRHENAEEEMELDYWTVGTLNALEALSESDRNSNLPLEISARGEMNQIALDYCIESVPADVREAITVTRDDNAPYLFSNPTYDRIYQQDAPEGYHELLSLYSYDLRIGSIYEKD